MQVALEPAISSVDPVFDHIVAEMRADRPIVYSKINHAFWERLIFLERAGESYLEQDAEQAARIDRIGRHTPALVGTGFVREVIEQLAEIPTRDRNFLFAAGLDAMPYSGLLQGIPAEGVGECQAVIDTYVPAPEHDLLADGVEFKRAALNGKLAQFADLLKNKDFILVANEDLQLFPEFIGAASAQCIVIDGARSRYDRHSILSKLKSKLADHGPGGCVVIQAGGSLAFWLAQRLHIWDPSISYFDLGNALCVCNPKSIGTRIFGEFYRAQLVETIETIHPGWIEKHADAKSDFADREQFDALEFRTGRSGLLGAAMKQRDIPLPTHIWNPEVALARPVDFIENKPPDLERIDDIMTLSRRQNHYANSGPVSVLLEQLLAQTLGLPKERRVVLCSSCTTGLQVAHGVAAIRFGRQLSWVGSDFTFNASHIGKFSGLRLLDCDEHGVLDPAKLRALSDDQWDGVVFTNTFARHVNEWRKISRFCENNEKALVVDNALGLLDRPIISAASREIEVISLHHTKPWGFGEGGIIICHMEDESIARKLINFGIGLGDEARSYACNGKISDLSCAAILERIERMDHWGRFYIHQARRLQNIIRNNDIPLEPLARGRPCRSIPGHLPYVAKHAVSNENLVNDFLTLRKYYRPLSSPSTKSGSASFPRSHDLYHRIINIPCHPYVRTLDEKEICSALVSVLEKSKMSGTI